MEDSLLKFGISGIFILALIFDIRWGAKFMERVLKEHKEERENWISTQEKLQEDTNKTIRENTNILSGLKTLIENFKKLL